MLTFDTPDGPRESRSVARASIYTTIFPNLHLHYSHERLVLQLARDKYPTTLQTHPDKDLSPYLR